MSTPLARCAVVVPVFNAEATLMRVIEDVQALGAGALILVDDGSKDRSASIAAAAGVAPLKHARNQGYGAAQKTGYRAALETGLAVVALLHDDLQYEPQRLAELIAPLLDGHADATVGSRMLRPGALNGGMPLPRWAANRVLTAIQNWGYRSRLTDFHSGFRAYTAETLQKISFGTFADDFRFDLQMLDAILRSGHRVQEIAIPARYGPDTGSMSYWAAPRYAASVVVHALKARTGVRP